MCAHDSREQAIDHVPFDVPGRFAELVWEQDSARLICTRGRGYIADDGQVGCDPNRASAE